MLALKVVKIMSKIGRSAKTGQFITVKEAQKHPSTSVIETIKKK
jgi:hypothetical protein